MFWELVKYMSGGFVVVTWILILLTAINGFDIQVLHNKNAYWVPVSVLTCVALFGYWLARRKVHERM